MTTADGGCLLHAAALSLRADVLEAALGSLALIGVALNQQDAHGRTPLHVAVAAGVPEMVRGPRANATCLWPQGECYLPLAPGRTLPAFGL